MSAMRRNWNAFLLDVALYHLQVQADEDQRKYARECVQLHHRFNAPNASKEELFEVYLEAMEFYEDCKARKDNQAHGHKNCDDAATSMSTAEDSSILGSSTTEIMPTNEVVESKVVAVEDSKVEEPRREEIYMANTMHADKNLVLPVQVETKLLPLVCASDTSTHLETDRAHSINSNRLQTFDILAATPTVDIIFIAALLI